ncbi:MAG: hypothetical protein U1E05_14480, partial [Patescibacteria group bacterium]|nr:hypothetical protein [Patescibacteria group bacterium]
NTDDPEELSMNTCFSRTDDSLLINMPECSSWKSGGLAPLFVLRHLGEAAKWRIGRKKASTFPGANGTSLESRL